jgi:hypothetical protein
LTGGAGEQQLSTLVITFAGWFRRRRINHKPTQYKTAIDAEIDVAENSSIVQGGLNRRRSAARTGRI